MEYVESSFGIIYDKNAFCISELVDLQKSLKIHSIGVLTKEKSPYVNACIDLFSPLVLIGMSPDIVQALVTNVASSGVYDAIKVLTSFLYSKFHNRFVTKLQGNKKTIEAANVQIVLGNSRLVLPINIDQEKYEYAVDKFFENVKCGKTAQKGQDSVYYLYSEDERKFIAKTEKQIVTEVYERQQRR